jgi:hypothetical protein
LQLLLIDCILPSCLWSSDGGMDHAAGRSQLKRESEITVDQGIGLKVRNIGPGI